MYYAPGKLIYENLVTLKRKLLLSLITCQMKEELERPKSFGVDKGTASLIVCRDTKVILENMLANKYFIQIPRARLQKGKWK